MTFHFRKASRTSFTCCGGNGLVRTTPRISAPICRVSGTISMLRGVCWDSDIFCLLHSRRAGRPNDEQRRRWFLSYSVRLWRSGIGAVALPLVDLLQRSAHQRCLVALGQAFGVAERRHTLLIGQHADCPRPVGAPHATIQPKRIDYPQYRIPDIVVWERLVRHRAGAADLHPYVLVLSQGEELRKIGPNVGGDRRASRLQQAEMVDNDDRIGVL